MTLTADRRTRGGVRTVPAERAVLPVPAGRPAPRPKLIATLVLPDVYRVQCDEVGIGYIQMAGPVFVALQGPVYNTSLEIGQYLDLAAAVSCLERALES